MVEHGVNGSWRDPVLINTIGHSAGVLLFGLIIALLIRDWRTHGMRRTKLSLAAALLAFGWNIGSLIVLASHDPALIEFVATASFSMLSLLPAILLQVAVHGQHRVVVAAGYVVSASAVTLHFCEPFFLSTGLHQAGLVSVVFGFGVLTITAFLLGFKRGAERPEWISLGCLLLFTSSFLHFGYQHFSSLWAAEITWHHIGIPVALIVLLGDYRFLLLDTFIRFLVNTGLAAVYIAAVLVVSQKFQLWDLIRPSMFLTGIALVALCLLLISFAYVRNSLQAWVSRVILRRHNVDDCSRAIVNLASPARSEEELLAQAGQQIADHLEAERFAIVAEPRVRSASLRPSVLFGEYDRDGFPRDDFHAEVQLPLRFSSGDGRYLILGSRRGGRRYRSDDLDDMRRLGAAIVEQVERFRAEELRRLVNQAELRALQAQINPHFLFNALNTLYGTIDRGSREARRMLINLAEISLFSTGASGSHTVVRRTPNRRGIPRDRSYTIGRPPGNRVDHQRLGPIDLDSHPFHPAVGRKRRETWRHREKGTRPGLGKSGEGRRRFADKHRGYRVGIRTKSNPTARGPVLGSRTSAAAYRYVMDRPPNYEFSRVKPERP